MLQLLELQSSRCFGACEEAGEEDLEQWVCSARSRNAAADPPKGVATLATQAGWPLARLPFVRAEAGSRVA